MDYKYFKIISIAFVIVGIIFILFSYNLGLFFAESNLENYGSMDTSQFLSSIDHITTNFRTLGIITSIIAGLNYLLIYNKELDYIVSQDNELKKNN